MAKKFISRQTSLPLQPAKSSFSPRPFAPNVQAKAQDDTTAPLVEHSSDNNRLSRLIHPEPVPESPQIGPEVGIESPENQHKIQRKHQDSFARFSAVPPTPPSTPRFPIQAKLTVGAAGDKYEEEADRVARQVVNRIQAPQVNFNSSESNPVQRKISIQALGGEGGDVSSEWEGQLNQARGGGQRLSPSVKEPMEREFGADFSGVRVHTGGQADGLARSIQAQAFTTGQDVFFRQGAYQPGSRGGQELLAHELTHVVQQNTSTIRRKIGPDVPVGTIVNRIKDKKFFSIVKASSDEKGRWNYRVQHQGKGKKFFVRQNDNNYEITSKYDYVFIGAGATTAYYIQENIENLKGKTILVIGPDQPWAGERGPGKINHPMSQIVPDRPPELGQELAARTGAGSFSEWVETVLKSEGLNIHREPSRIKKKPKLVDSVYQIEFEDDKQNPIAAKNVILAIGIGPHAKPEGYDKIEQANKSLPKEDNATISLPRVMSLDEFQRSIEQLKTTFTKFTKTNNSKPVIVLVGPNAGIDAVTTYARELTEFADLKWIAKSLEDIPFLEGTDNAKGKKLAENLEPHDKYEFQLITDRFKSVKIDKEKVVADTTGKSVLGNLLVYALGPEKNFLDQFLPEGQEAKGLEPIYDRSNRISSARDQVDSGSKLDYSKISIEKRIRKWAIAELKTGNSQITEEEITQMIDQEQITELVKLYNTLTKREDNQPAPDFGRKKLPKNSMEVSVVGLQVPKDTDDAPSFQILGGSAYRLAEKVSYKHHSESISRVIEVAKESDKNENPQLIELADSILKKTKEIEILAEPALTLLVSREEKDKPLALEAKKNLDAAVKELIAMQREMKKALKVNNNTAKILSPISRYTRSLISSIQGFDAKKNPSNPFKASTHINEIASTHPVNVALGDQLTSVMSQIGVASEQNLHKEQIPIEEDKKSSDAITKEELKKYQEAQEKFEKQRNLIVNDATTIAMFIASAYPAIPPVIANGITRQIIWDRRYGEDAKSAVPKYDLATDKADTTSQYDYQVEWKVRLNELNKISLKLFNK